MIITRIIITLKAHGYSYNRSWKRSDIRLSAIKNRLIITSAIIPLGIAVDIRVALNIWFCMYYTKVRMHIQLAKIFCRLFSLVVFFSNCTIRSVWLHYAYILGEGHGRPMSLVFVKLCVYQNPIRAWALNYHLREKMHRTNKISYQLIR